MLLLSMLKTVCLYICLFYRWSVVVWTTKFLLYLFILGRCQKIHFSALTSIPRAQKFFFIIKCLKGLNSVCSCEKRDAVHGTAPCNLYGITNSYGVLWHVQHGPFFVAPRVCYTRHMSIRPTYEKPIEHRRN